MPLVATPPESKPKSKPVRYPPTIEPLIASAPSYAESSNAATFDPPLRKKSPEPRREGEPPGEPVSTAARTEPRPPGSGPVLPGGCTETLASHGVARCPGFFAVLGIIIYVVTDNGTVKITGTDYRMKVSIDGEDIIIENLGKPITIRAGPARSAREA